MCVLSACPVVWCGRNSYVSTWRNMEEGRGIIFSPIQLGLREDADLENKLIW